MVLFFGQFTLEEKFLFSKENRDNYLLLTDSPKFLILPLVEKVEAIPEPISKN